LDGDDHCIPATLSEWARWFETHERTVGWTQINSQVWVSTVFLGIDHRYWGKGPPIVFETMVFRDHEGIEQQRYSSWDDAEAGHAAMVKKYRSAKVRL
jgi:hypothetical protein